MIWWAEDNFFCLGLGRIDKFINMYNGRDLLECTCGFNIRLQLLFVKFQRLNEHKLITIVEYNTEANFIQYY